VATFFVAAQATPPVSGVLLMAALLLLMFGFASAAGYQVVARRQRPAHLFRGPSPLLVFGFELIVVNIASVLLAIVGVPISDSGPAFMVASVVLFAGYLFVVWLFGFRTGALDLRGIGLPLGAGAGRWLADIGVGAATMLAVAVLAGLWGALIALLLGTTAPEVVPIPTTGLDIVFVVLGACILIPIGEELFFRGYTVTAWLRDLGERSALIRSTIFFAAIHILNITVDPNAGSAIDGAKQALLEFLVIAPVGFALGWLFIRRGLVAAIAGHAAFNTFGVLILVLAQLAPSQ